MRVRTLSSLVIAALLLSATAAGQEDGRVKKPKGLLAEFSSWLRSKGVDDGRVRLVDDAGTVRAESTRQARDRAVRAWVCTHTCEALTGSVLIQGWGKGIVARQAIKEGERLFRIPLKWCLHSVAAKRNKHLAQPLSQGVLPRGMSGESIMVALLLMVEACQTGAPSSTCELRSGPSRRPLMSTNAYVFVRVHIHKMHAGHRPRRGTPTSARCRPTSPRRSSGMSRVVPPLHCRGVWLQPIHYVQVYGLICMISCIGRFYGTLRVVQPIHLCKCMQYVHECVHRCVHEYVCVCMHVNMNMCIQKQSLMPMHIHVYIYLSAITTPTDKTRAGQGAQGQPARRNGRFRPVRYPA